MTNETPRWLRARVAHPVDDLDRSTAFYRDLLGLVPHGGFTGHDGYDGVFLALPGGGELELTAGPVRPQPGTEDDLLVLYLRDHDEVRRLAAGLAAAGVPEAPVANPYWQRSGRAFRDPDGYTVVVAATPEQPSAADGVRIEEHTGDRAGLRGLFALAEDSPARLEAYLDQGRVLVAVTADGVVGHLQLVETDRPGTAEILTLAVREDLQRRGIGALLVAAAVELAAAGAARELVVATAAADIGNLRFYQRQGFRMRAVERDAFTPADGYPPGLTIDGIPLRDRVVLDRPVAPGGDDAGRPATAPGAEPAR